MKIARNKTDLDACRKHFTGKTAFVPTMGALHTGHISLVKCAKQRADHVVVSIFVNPTQFAPHEDFDAYPREEEKDMEKLKNTGVDLVFLPQTADLYPDGMENKYNIGDAAKGLETDFRPHFFGGVVNVVSRLFDAVKPDIAIFGEKDFQQLQVIQEMVETYGMDIDIIGAPIIRDQHGLALSSRNQYLSVDELEVARKLNKIIAQDIPIDSMKAALLEAGFDKIDYIQRRWNRILVAAWLGKTRLIDNMST